MFRIPISFFKRHDYTGILDVSCPPFISIQHFNYILMYQLCNKLITLSLPVSALLRYTNNTTFTL